MKKIFIIAVLACTMMNLDKSMAQAPADPAAESNESIKQKILQLAKSYEGQGDPDQSKQKINGFNSC